MFAVSPSAFFRALPVLASSVAAAADDDDAAADDDGAGSVDDDAGVCAGVLDREIFRPSPLNSFGGSDHVRRPRPR